jgi:ABC-type sugar transport system substrate-binding protein
MKVSKQTDGSRCARCVAQHVQEPAAVNCGSAAAQVTGRSDWNCCSAGQPGAWRGKKQVGAGDAAQVTKPGALLVAPTDSAALDPDLVKVQKGGAEIVFVDTSSADAAIGLSRISSDNAQGGRLAADTLGKLLGGKGIAAAIDVAKGVSTTDARIAGFQQEMATKFPGLNGAFAANLVTAQGAASGIQHAHKTGTIKLATFDADPGQIAMMQRAAPSSWPSHRSPRLREPTLFCRD